VRADHLRSDILRSFVPRRDVDPFCHEPEGKACFRPPVTIVAVTIEVTHPQIGARAVGLMITFNYPC
jgi:hypothetical protein